MKTFLSSVAAGMLLSAGLVGGALAQSNWNLDAGNSTFGGCVDLGTSGTFGNSTTCKGNNNAGSAAGNAGVNAVLSAWSTDKGTGTVNQLSGSGFANAFLSDQGTSGWGAKNRTEGVNATSPDHSVDSIAPGLVDMLMVNFKNASNQNVAVSLTDLRIDWKGTDADLTVLRWTGDAAGPGISGGLMTTTGWSLVGSYADLASGTSRSLGTTTGASSWWLISAFDSTLNGGSNSCKAANGSTAHCDNSNDAFKLAFLKTAVAANCPNGSAPGASGGCGGGGGGGSIPEPGSLALAGVALLGAFGARRRLGKKA